jgi:hypothetical protein
MRAGERSSSKKEPRAEVNDRTWAFSWLEVLFMSLAVVADTFY